MASFDPLAGSQIDVDPALKPKSPKEVAERRQQLIEMFLRGGATQAQAEAEADRYLAEFPIATGQTIPQSPAPSPAAPMNPQQSMEADLYAQGYSADEARKQAQLQAELRAEREAKQLEQDLSQGGYGQRRVPSPRDMNDRASLGAPFASMDEARSYSDRSVDEAGRVVLSQRDAAMRERGFVPVVAQDGSVAYQLEYTSDAGGAPGRAGYRKGLIDSGKYEPVPAKLVGGVGDTTVLAPTDAFRQKMVEQNKRVKEAQDRRNPYKDLDSPAERMRRFQAQLQLGGGRLSPQAIQLETMLNDMTPEQRQQAMRYMVPGGQFAAGVDAQNMQNANDVIKRFMTSGAAGLLPNPAVQAQVQQQQAVHRAGREDDLGNLYAPSGMFGYDEFTPDEQELMYNDLIAEGYTDQEARAAVNRQSQKRRATIKKYGPPPAAAAPPPAGVAPGSVPPI